MQRKNNNFNTFVFAILSEILKTLVLFAPLTENKSIEVLPVLRSCDTAKHESTEKTILKKIKSVVDIFGLLYTKILLTVFQIVFLILMAVVLIAYWFYWLSVLMIYRIVKRIFVQNSMQFTLATCTIAHGDHNFYTNSARAANKVKHHFGVNFS